MSRQEIASELLRQEEEREYYEASQKAYLWLLENVYAYEETRI